MGKSIGIGLLGLGTVGAGVANIIQTPLGRHPLVSEIKLVRVAVRDINRPRKTSISQALLTIDPIIVIDDPAVEVVVEVAVLVVVGSCSCSSNCSCSCI